jgi:primosomal protein N' (replication factor Y)
MTGSSHAQRYVEVIVDVPLDQPLVYALNAPAEAAALAGLRCVVPVGRRTHVGIVTSFTDQPAIDLARIRPVARILDDVGPLSSHWLDLTRFAGEYYQHPWGEVALPALPPALRTVPGPRHARSVERLRARAAVVAAPAGVIVPTAEQQTALRALAEARGFGTYLLFGVTGSGKTEVYLMAIERHLAADPGSQALLLVPEINLTPQLESSLRGRFPGVSCVALHSGLSDTQRSSAWLAAHEGRARIVIGTRLAVFASMPRLAIIVVDEEHDPSYKAGEGVRYSARDLAIKRAQMLGIPIIVGSATPSLETWARASAGSVRLLELKQRIGEEQDVPAVELIDSRAHPPAHGLCEPVVGALTDTLARGEQSLVFLNRRGYAPVVACEACGWLSHCPRCSTFAVFHKPDRSLHCHHCGHSERVPRACPTCGNQGLKGVGHGTQRIEESLQALLPAARIVRIDRDTTRRRHSAEQAFDAVHAGTVDVLVGTQMIAKGHDYQRVSLVVVVNPDGQLVSHDFRAPERLFSTLVQVAGRAGRAGLPSRVLVQTRFPSHPLFAALARQDYAAFADAQLAERRAANMPPYSHQALLTAEARSMDAALGFLREARSIAGSTPGVRLYDPVPMPMQRLAGSERAQLLVEADRRSALQPFLRTWLAALRARRSRVRWQIEVDPQQI